MSNSTEPASNRGRLSLALALLLGACALGGAAAALLVDESSVLVVLAVSACVAFVGLVCAFFSLRGARLGPSLAAIMGSLVVLAAIGVAFGAVSLERVVDAVENPGGPARAVTDPDFAFTLQPPAPDATMYDADSVAALNDRARAGFWTQSDLTGLVFVETVHAPLAEAAEAELHLCFADAPEHQTAPTTTQLHGREAVRVRRQVGAANADPTYSESTFFERDGWLVHLYAQGPLDAPDFESANAWFPQIHAAYEELDTPVDHVPAEPYAISDRGPGWNVTRNRYEDTAWGFSFETPPDFTLRWRERSPERAAGWIVSLERRRPDVWVSIRPEHAWQHGLELPNALDATAAPDPEAPHMERSMLGVPTELSAWTWQGGYVQRARYGVVERDGRRYAVLAWSPSREAADQAVDAALEGLRPAEEPRSGSTRVSQSMFAIGARRWARGDTVRYIDVPVEWQRPSAGWRTVTAAPNVIGAMTNPTAGLFAQLESDVLTDGTPASVLAQDFAGAGASPTPEELGADRSYVPPTVMPSGESMAACARRWEQRVYLLYVWGSPDDMSAAATEVRGACEGLRPASGPTSVGWDESRRWVDPQLGFSFEPPSEARIETAWEELDGDVGRLLHVDDDGNTIVLLARVQSPYEPPETTENRLLREHYAWAVDGSGQTVEREAELAGQPCQVRERRVPFDVRVTTVVRMVHEGVLYVLLTDGPPRGVDPEEVMARFALL